MRGALFGTGFGVTLIAAVVIFAAATVVAIVLGYDRVELAAGELLFYRFATGRDGTLVHIGPLVFMLAALVGAVRALVAPRLEAERTEASV